MEAIRADFLGQKTGLRVAGSLAVIRLADYAAATYHLAYACVTDTADITRLVLAEMLFAVGCN